MTESTSWIVFIPIALGIVAIALLLWGDARAQRGFYVEDRSLVCPLSQRNVVATLVRAGPTGRILGVRRCTGPNPELVTCGKECIAGLQDRAKKPAEEERPASQPVPDC